MPLERGIARPASVWNHLPHARVRPLESPKVNDFVKKYPKKGSDAVGQVRCVEPDSEAVSRQP